MAPPASRRPGFSRRAQYGLFFGYVVAVAGIVVALLLLVVAVIDPRGFAAIKGAALDATAPVSAGGRSISGFFTGIGDTVGNYFRAGSQNARLRQQLAAARRELVAARATEAQNRRLMALLGLARETRDEITIARIVGSTYNSPRRLATLSAGTSAGVRPGQPVRSPDGLIGRVIEAGRWASRILLVIDGASSVPVRSVRDGTAAFAVGRGDGTIELRTIEVGTNPFRRGDIVVTSGVGGIFPPDIPVAVVVRIEDDLAIARPLARPGHFDYAIVQPAYQPAVDGALDQATPQPTGGPVLAPPASGPTGPGRATPSRLQQNPRYQPALQDPNPNAVRRAPVPPTQPQPQPGQPPR